MLIKNTLNMPNKIGKSVKMQIGKNPIDIQKYSK